MRVWARFGRMANLSLTKLHSTLGLLLLPVPLRTLKIRLLDQPKSSRDSVGLAFGTFGKDENSVFNVDVVIDKLKRMVDAAKGFGENLKKLTKQGAGADVNQRTYWYGSCTGKHCR